MSTRLESTESFLERLFRRRSRPTKARTRSRYLQSSRDHSVEAPVFVLTPSPNTHPLLTRPLPRDEPFRGPDMAGQISELGRDSTTAAVIKGRYTSWHSPQSPDINLQIRQTEVISEYSGHDCTFEWGFFNKCYAEVCILMNKLNLYWLTHRQGRFNLSNPPEPPSLRPFFQYYPAPTPTNEINRLKAMKTLHHSIQSR